MHSHLDFRDGTLSFIYVCSGHGITSYEKGNHDKGEVVFNEQHLPEMFLYMHFFADS